MKSPHTSRKPRELGIVWYLIPVLWVVAAVGGFVTLSWWPVPLAESLPAQSRADASAFPVSNDSSVPAAADVFKDRLRETSQHVDTF
jgi:hypothetical protein